MTRSYINIEVITHTSKGRSNQLRRIICFGMDFNGFQDLSKSLMLKAVQYLLQLKKLQVKICNNAKKE
jgi:hypothetical protein